MAPVVSDAVSRREARMRGAARSLFLELGYRVSMDAVAQRAGVSKQTVYAHFGDKQQLFKCVVLQMLESDAPPPGDDGELRDDLVAFARAHLTNIYRADSVAACRMLIGEAARFPAEALALYEAAAARIQVRLKARLSRAVGSGQLRDVDLQSAADLLLGMLDGTDHHRRLFGLAGRDGVEIDDWSDFAVDAFLRAFSIEFATSTRKQS
ncbi:MAG: TetR/AcrR family transcriptional regulator [Tahibacter sp.]